MRACWIPTTFYARHVVQLSPGCKPRHVMVNAAHHPSQLFNAPGIKVLLDVVARGKQALIVPHLSVTAIYHLDWPRISSLGFKGCVFDKDNTLTKPYNLVLEPGVEQSLAQCRDAFNGNIIIFSNSAGLLGFDTEYQKADELERALGIPVLRHRSKKPAGGCQEVLERFNCEANELVIVGDRVLTDIVFGNLTGALSIQVQPFDVRGESFVVRAARKLETRLQRRAMSRNVQPPEHVKLTPHGEDISKDLILDTKHNDT